MLSKKTALVIGAGGLGTPVLLSLAAAGVGKIILFDDDVVDISNLHRQVLFGADDIGMVKVERVKEIFSNLFPNLEVVARGETLQANNVAEAFKEADIVFDGCDRVMVKYLLSDAGVIAKRPVIHAGAQRFQGQTLLIRPGGQPCLRCIFNDTQALIKAPSPRKLGVSGASAGTIGALQALIGINYMTEAEETDFTGLFAYNGQENRFTHLRVNAETRCPVCGDTKTINKFEEGNYQCGAISGPQPLLETDKLSRNQRAQYDRQMRLAEWGITGQEKLLTSRVLIHGLDISGQLALLYLIGAGVGRIYLSDDRRIDEAMLLKDNILFTKDDLGGVVSFTAQRKLQAKNHDVKIEPVSESSAEGILENNSSVILVSNSSISRRLFGKLQNSIVAKTDAEDMPAQNLFPLAPLPFTKSGVRMPKPRITAYKILVGVLLAEHTTRLIAQK